MYLSCCTLTTQRIVSLFLRALEHWNKVQVQGLWLLECLYLGRWSCAAGDLGYGKVKWDEFWLTVLRWQLNIMKTCGVIVSIFSGQYIHVYIYIIYSMIFCYCCTTGYIVSSLQLPASRSVSSVHISNCQSGFAWKWVICPLKKWLIFIREPWESSYHWVSYCMNHTFRWTHLTMQLAIGSAGGYGHKQVNNEYVCYDEIFE